MEAAWEWQLESQRSKRPGAGEAKSEGSRREVVLRMSKGEGQRAPMGCSNKKVMAMSGWLRELWSGDVALAGPRDGVNGR